MRKALVRLLALCLFLAIAAVLHSRAQDASAQARDPQDWELTTAEKAEVLGFAKRFTTRLYEAKDLAPLVDEFFVAGFPENIRKDDADETSPFSKLTGDELRKSYVAYLNLLFYLSLSEKNEDSSTDDPQQKLFPPTLAEKLNEIGKDASIEVDDMEVDLTEFRVTVTRMERTLADARDYLRNTPPERVPVLTREVTTWSEDAAYSMKGYWSDDAPAESKATQVFLPFLLDIVVVKHGGGWKIWAMFPDGD